MLRGAGGGEAARPGPGPAGQRLRPRARGPEGRRRSGRDGRVLAGAVPHDSRAAEPAGRPAASAGQPVHRSPPRRHLRCRPGAAGAPVRHRQPHHFVLHAAGRFRSAHGPAQRPAGLRGRHPHGRPGAHRAPEPDCPLRELHRRALPRRSRRHLRRPRRGPDASGPRPQRSPGIHLSESAQRAAPAAVDRARSAGVGEFHPRAVVCRARVRRPALDRALGAARDVASRPARERDGDARGSVGGGRLQRRHLRRRHGAALARRLPRLSRCRPRRPRADRGHAAPRLGDRVAAIERRDSGRDAAALRPGSAAGAALRGGGGAHAGGHRADLRGSRPVVSGAERSRQPHRARVAGPRRGPRRAGRRLPRTRRPPAGRAARRAQGRRRLPAHRPGLSQRAPGVHAGRRRRAGAGHAGLGGRARAGHRRDPGAGRGPARERGRPRPTRRRRAAPTTWPT